MKKSIKVTLISLGSLLAVTLITVCIAIWIVFTPERLTPIVRSQADKYLTCQTQFGTVDLTFFSTFPNFAVRLQDVLVINPKEGAPSDTLASLNSCIAIIDLGAYLNDNNIAVKRFEVDGGQANVYVAADGTTNYDIVASTDTTSQASETTGDLGLNRISIEGVGIRNLSLDYVDESTPMHAQIYSLGATLEAEQQFDLLRGNVNLDVNCGHVVFAMADSLPADSLSLQLDGFGFSTLLVMDHLNLQEGGLFNINDGGFRVRFDTLSVQMSDLNVNGSGIRVTLADMKADSTHLDIKATAVLGTLDVLMGGDEGMCIQLADASIGIPSFCYDTCLQTRIKTELGDFLLAMGQDVYIDHQSLSLQGNITAGAAFDRFSLDLPSVVYADEQLSLKADVAMPDTTTTDAAIRLGLKQTTFEHLLSLVPDAFVSMLDGIDLQGNVDLDLAAAVTLRGEQMQIKSFDITGNLGALQAQMDNMNVKTSALNLTAQYPTDLPKERIADKKKRRSNAKFISAVVQSPDLAIVMKDDTTNIAATLSRLKFDGIVTDEILTDTTQIPFISANFAYKQLDATVDTLAVHSTDGQGLVTLASGRRHQKKYYEFDYKGSSLNVKNGSELDAQFGLMSINANSIYDARQDGFLLQYSPHIDVKLEGTQVQTSAIPYLVKIPKIDFNFTLGNFQIHDSRIQLGNSDFQLKGEVYNIDQYLRDEGLLTATLDFTSDTTDVSQLMALVDGFGVVDSTASAVSATAKDAATAGYNAEGGGTVSKDAVVASTITTDEAGEPFMVPKGVDFTLNTKINHALVNENDFTGLGGKVTIQDGVLVLEEMGFSSKAARMQLTAVYKSPTRDHLFVGANFHLLDIEVADLIHLIPDVDTIVPMLKSFDGKAEFHLAAETNLTANYDLKMSTLKATAAIEGKDLVLMDNETFSTISKYLMFKKKTRNVVDSISVEMAVSRKKARIYPFLISMDKYQAVIAGTNGITDDMPFDYHISITNCPLPTRLGLDISGNMNDLHYKLAKCKYANLYKPEKRNIAQQQTLDMKSLISSSLKKTVKPQAPALIIEENKTQDLPEN